MRTIHRRRKSRFFSRRCSYANCPARCCVWSAVLYSFLLPEKLPFDALRTFLRRARPGTTVLERGILLSSCPRRCCCVRRGTGLHDFCRLWENQAPSIFRTRAWSAGATTRFEPFLRFELRLSDTMPWRRFDERRIALPVPESLKRFRAARLVFILGIGKSFSFGASVRDAVDRPLVRGRLDRRSRGLLLGL